MKPNGFSTCKHHRSTPQFPLFLTRGASSFNLHPLTFKRFHFPSKTTTISSSTTGTTSCRRRVLLAKLIATGAVFLLSSSSKANEANTNTTPPQLPPLSPSAEEEAGIGWRIYDSTVIGEPMAVGKEKRKGVWEKVMKSRVVYLGEAEQVPTKDDKVLEREILKVLRKRCVASEKSVSLALEAFPSNLQPQLDQFLDKR